MRVILLGDTVRYPLTGIGRYTVALFSALAEQAGKVQLWHDGRLQSSLPTDSGEPVSGLLKRNWRARVLQWLSPMPWLLDVLHRFKQYWQSRRLAAVALNTVVHGPNYELPRVQCARVVTIHDLSVFAWAHCHPTARVVRMRRVIERSVRSAHRIITDSEFNRQELLTQFKLLPEQVVAIPLACDSRFSVAAATWPLARGLDSKSYALFVGTVEPRKNLDTLLSAWELLPESFRQQVPLVIAGGPGWRSEQIHARLRVAEQAGWVRYLGFVPDQELPALYAHARLFCFPSWYEGFGLPVLEAMASGVPVVCSSASCLSEVGGDAVRYAAPDDSAAWAAEVLAVLGDPAEAERLLQAGLRRAQQFSWANTAKQTLQVYREAMAIFEREQAT